MTNNLLKNKLIREEREYSDYWANFSKKCPVCDCSNYMKPNVDVMRCKICGTKIYKDEKTKFKYELGKRLKNGKGKRRAVSKNDK